MFTFTGLLKQATTMQSFLDVRRASDVREMVVYTNSTVCAGCWTEARSFGENPQSA